MYKTIIALAFGTLFLPIAANTSYAASTKASEPLSQSQVSIDKNLQKNPGNTGLQNADERLKANQTRQEKKRAEQNAKRKTKKIAKNVKLGKPAEKTPEHEMSGREERMENSGSQVRRDR